LPPVTIPRQLLLIPTWYGGGGARYKLRQERAIKLQFWDLAVLRGVRRGEVSKSWATIKKHVSNDLTMLNHRVTNWDESTAATDVYITMTSKAMVPANEVSVELAGAALALHRLPLTYPQYREYKVPEHIEFVTLNSDLTKMCLEMCMTQLEKGVDYQMPSSSFGIVDMIAALPNTPIREVLIWGLRNEIIVDWHALSDLVVKSNSKLGELWNNAFRNWKNRIIPVWWLAGDVDLGMSEINSEMRQLDSSMIRDCTLYVIEREVLSIMGYSVPKRTIQEIVGTTENGVSILLLEHNLKSNLRFAE
jgi:hypothetical protein